MKEKEVKTKKLNLTEFFKNILRIHPAPVIILLEIDEKNYIRVLAAAGDRNSLLYALDKKEKRDNYFG